MLGERSVKRTNNKRLQGEAGRGERRRRCRAASGGLAQLVQTSAKNLPKIRLNQIKANLILCLQKLDSIRNLILSKLQEVQKLQNFREVKEVQKVQEVWGGK